MCLLTSYFISVRVQPRFSQTAGNERLYTYPDSAQYQIVAGPNGVVA
jgi:hypothetical protein